MNERHDKIFEESQGGVTTVRTGPQGTKLVYQFWDPSRNSRGGVGYKAARSLEDALNKWKAAGSISPPSASVRPPAHRAPAPIEAAAAAGTGTAAPPAPAVEGAPGTGPPAPSVWRAEVFCPGLALGYLSL